MRPETLRAGAPPGRAPAPRARDRRRTLGAPRRRAGARLPAAARARRRRRVARPRGAPVLRARARARVPVRLLLPRRRRRGARTRRSGRSDRDGEREVFERFVDWLVERRRRLSRAARLPLRRLRAHRAHAPDGRARDARARDRRPPPRRGARRPLPRRQAVAPRLGRRATRSRRSRRSTGSSARRGVGWRRVGRPLRGLARDGRRVAPRRGRALQRGGLPLDRRAARVAPLDPAGRACRGGSRPRSASRRRRRSRATPSARRSASALLAGAEDGRPDGASSRTSSTTTSARQRPQWWEWFRWPQLDDEELVRDRTAIGGLRLGRRAARGRGTEPRLPPDLPAAGAQARRPAGHSTRARQKAFRIQVDDDHGIVTLSASIEREDEPLPRGLTPGKPIGDKVKREALFRFAARVRGRASSGAIRRSRRCSSAGRPPCGSSVDPVEAALTLGESYLFVQGPPGSGKTWQGARMAVALMRAGQAGRRHLAEPQGDPQPAPRDPARGGRAGLHVPRREARARRGGRGRETSPSIPSIEASTMRTSAPTRRIDLVAGTGVGAHPRDGRHPRRPSARSTCSSSTRRGSSRSPTCSRSAPSARSLVLLGDPNQLPQVSQGSHPEGSGALGAPAPARRRRDRAARPRALPRADLAAAARALRVHLRRRTTRAASATRR